MNNTKLERFLTTTIKLSSIFGAATIIWGVVGMLVGVIAATQLFLPETPTWGNPYN